MSDILNSSALQEFFELSLDMLAIAGTDGYFKLLNPAWEQTLGHSTTALLAQPYLDLVHPEDRDRTILEASRLSEGQTTVSFENRYRCSDDSYKWLLWKAAPVPNSDRIVAIARDITERKRYEEALATASAELGNQVQEQSEELDDTLGFLRETRKVLHRLVANLPGMAYRCRNDADWTMIYVSNGVAELTGYKRSDLVDNSRISYADLIEPDDRQMVNEIVDRAVRGGVPFQIEYRIRPAPGGQKWVWEQGRAVYGKDGEALYLEGLILDASERKQAEETVRRQAALIDEARDAIFVRDLQDRIVFWSKGAERVFGWSADEVRDKTAAQALASGDSGDFEAAMKETIEKGEWTGEFHERRKDGQEIVVASRWSLLRDDRGEPRGALAIATDITRRKLLEEQLLRAQRLESVGTLASGIAHDLNNALTPVLMASQVLRRKYGDQDARTLDMLETSAKRGANLVKQVLTFGRGMAGEPVVLQLRHAVKEFGKVVEQTFPKSIRLHVDLPKDLWAVSADPTQIDQVLMNLGINARDAMPDGGTLTITAKNVDVDATYAGMQHEATPGRYVRLEVADTGEGMASEIQDRIFDPFFTTKALSKGTGLGLSTVHTIARNHGGFVTVYSELGHGSTFKIYLPAADGIEAEPVSKKASEVSGRGQTVMVVDDEDVVREMVSSVLEDSGYRAVAAKNGAEAVACFARGGIDIVLVDWDMPVMNGPQTLQAILNIDSQARIVASSGISHTAEIDNLKIPVPFLPKPYTAEDLLSKLSEIAGEPETNQPPQES